MKVEEEFVDVMQNIEFAVIAVYREYPDLTDYAVMRVYEALQRRYAAEVTGRPPPPRITEPDVEVLLQERVQEMCESRLRGESFPAMMENGKFLELPRITTEDMVRCLKRLVKSVKKWNDNGGRQSYLDFIRNFIV